MGLPTVTQTWTTAFNNRYVFQTLAGSMSAYMFGLKSFLKTTMGYTVKGSCNGSTGAMDGVDRWASAADASTRFNGASGSQSWFVLTDGAGVDWLLAYNSDIADWYHIGNSSGGVYAAAGTATFQPTATDENFNIRSNGTIVGTDGEDLVWHLWGSADKKIWRAVLCKSQTFMSYIAGEKLTSALISPATFTTSGGGTVGALNRYEKGADVNGGIVYGFESYWNSVYSMASAGGAVCHVHSGGSDTQFKGSRGGAGIGGGLGACQSAAGFLVENYPALQGSDGYLIFPATMGSNGLGFDGKLGNVIDEWFPLENVNTSPTFLTMFGDRLFWLFHPALILVGDGSTVLQTE